MNVYGIIGYPLSHSYSPGFYSEKIKNESIPNTEYKTFPLNDINKFKPLVHDNKDIKGLNVTSPYKETIIKYLNEIDKDSKFIGAVNTISIERSANGPYLKGYNTDAYGFEKSIKPYLQPHHKNALIIGSGGAAKAVEFVFKKLGVSYEIVTRRPLKAHHIIYWAVNRQIIEKNLILVNATPLGMHPGIMDYPLIPYEYITPDHIMFDLIYNPPTTRFLEFGEKAGATVINGMQMFKIQANRSWEIWQSAK